MLWGDWSIFHHGCLIKASELIHREFLEVIGDGSIHPPLVGGKILKDDDGGISMRIDVNRFGLGLFFYYVVYRLPSLNSLYRLPFVPLVGNVYYAGLIVYASLLLQTIDYLLYLVYSCFQNLYLFPQNLFPHPVLTKKENLFGIPIMIIMVSNTVL